MKLTRIAAIALCCAMLSAVTVDAALNAKPSAASSAQPKTSASIPDTYNGYPVLKTYEQVQNWRDYVQPPQDNIAAQPFYAPSTALHVKNPDGRSGNSATYPLSSDVLLPAPNFPGQVISPFIGMKNPPACWKKPDPQFYDARWNSRFGVWEIFGPDGDATGKLVDVYGNNTVTSDRILRSMRFDWEAFTYLGAVGRSVYDHVITREECDQMRREAIAENERYNQPFRDAGKTTTFTDDAGNTFEAAILDDGRVAIIDSRLIDWSPYNPCLRSDKPVYIRSSLWSIASFEDPDTYIPNPLSKMDPVSPFIGMKEAPKVWPRPYHGGSGLFQWDSEYGLWKYYWSNLKPGTSYISLYHEQTVDYEKGKLIFGGRQVITEDEYQSREASYRGAYKP